MLYSFDHLLYCARCCSALFDGDQKCWRAIKHFFLEVLLCAAQWNVRFVWPLAHAQLTLFIFNLKPYFESYVAQCRRSGNSRNVGQNVAFSSPPCTKQCRARTSKCFVLLGEILDSFDQGLRWAGVLTTQRILFLMHGLLDKIVVEDKS